MDLVYTPRTVTLIIILYKGAICMQCTINPSSESSVLAFRLAHAALFLHKHRTLVVFGSLAGLCCTSHVCLCGSLHCRSMCVMGNTRFGVVPDCVCEFV